MSRVSFCKTIWIEIFKFGGTCYLHIHNILQIKNCNFLRDASLLTRLHHTITQKTTMHILLMAKTATE